MPDPEPNHLRTDKDRRQFGYEQPGAGQDSTGGLAMLVLTILIAGTVVMLVLLSSVSANAEAYAGSVRLQSIAGPETAPSALRPQIPCCESLCRFSIADINATRLKVAWAIR